MSKKAISKKAAWFRIAREGGTVDGRTISGDALKEMAKKYSLDIYGARINKEHIRGFFLEDQFGAFGDVIDLKVETDESGKTCLLGLLDPTEELIKLNKKRQKVYTSIEMGKIEGEDGFYLTGLAVTDSPASTGTSMLNFSVGKSQKFSMKVKDENGDDQEVNFQSTAGDWSDHFETKFNFDALSQSNGEGLFAKVKTMLSKSTDKSDEKYSDASEAITLLAASQKDVLDQLGAMTYSRDIKNLTAKLEEQETLYTDLVEKLESESSPAFKIRPPQDNGNQEQTDC